MGSCQLPLQVAAFATIAATTHADWTIRSTSSEPGHAGVVHQRVVLENGASREWAIADLAIFSTKSCTLRVIDNQFGETLSNTMTQQKCAAGVNGGYFDTNFGPIGLLIVDGKVVAPLLRARLLTGVLMASSAGVKILRVSDFSRRQKPQAATEGGPFLVDLGERVHGLEGTREARRTFAATDRGNQVALGFCSDVTLAQLATIIATTQWANNFKVYRALNLDGGSSSAFWFARNNGSAFSIPEQKTVRDFVGVVPR